MATPSKIKIRVLPSQLAEVQAKLSTATFDSIKKVEALSNMGIEVLGSANTRASYQQMFNTSTLDSAVSGPVQVNPAQAGSPFLQFLQSVLPGQVRVLTQARCADKAFGYLVAGKFEDEEVIQLVSEPTGVAAVYSDYGDTPFAAANPTFAKRSVISFESGAQIGYLENLRAGAYNFDLLSEKRNAAMEALEIARNRVAFFGFTGVTDGVDVNAYGVLNDPQLPPLETLPSGKEWINAPANDVIKDLIFMLNELRVKSGGRVDPRNTDVVLLVANAAAGGLDNVPVDSPVVGQSAREFLARSYPNVTIVEAPELDKAVGGKNVALLFAKNVVDSGTDGGGAIEQIVPAKVFTVGVMQDCKSSMEVFANATAGCMVKRPFAVVGATGV